jgi:hypothetical protein
VALAVGLLLPAAARATIAYQYVTDMQSYTASAAGNSVAVQIILQETVTGNDTSLLTRTNGLFSYAYYATQTAGAGTGQSTISSYASAAPFTGNSLTSSPGSLPPNSFDFNGNQPVPTTSGPTGNVTSAGVRQILLGTLTIKAGTTTTFTLSSALRDPGDAIFAGTDGNTLTLPSNGPYDLDKGGTQTGQAGTVTFNGTDLLSYTFTVGVAVPEPGSLTLALLAASGTAVVAWRRRRSRQAGLDTRSG